MEEEILDLLLEDHFVNMNTKANAAPSINGDVNGDGSAAPRHQERLVKIRSSGTFGRISPVEYGFTEVH